VEDFFQGGTFMASTVANSTEVCVCVVLL